MRCLQTDVRIKVKDLINEFVNELPRVFGVRGEITYYPGYPVTMNHEQEARMYAKPSAAYSVNQVALADQSINGVRRFCMYARSLSWRLSLAVPTELNHQNRCIMLITILMTS
jgi:metal-dependent amidase/aminoacylase/carboxypeptidase family protein